MRYVGMNVLVDAIESRVVPQGGFVEDHSERERILPIHHGATRFLGTS
jgi:hypothetical protein